MHPTTNEDHRDTLALIHEAALDTGAWLPVLRRLAALTGCIAGGLTTENPSSGRGKPITFFGFDPDRVQRDFSYYLPMNPLFSIAPRMQPGFVVTNGDVVPLASFKRTEFYDGWARPQDLCSPITLVLHRDGTSFVPLTLVRPNGVGEASEADRDLLNDLAPHLMQALRTNLHLRLLDEQQQTLENAVERLTVGIVVLDRQHRITFLNGAAEGALQGNRGLGATSGRLAASDAALDGALQQAIVRALAEDGPASTDVTVPAEDSSRLNLSVIPLRRDAEAVASLGHPGACLIVISDPAALMASGVEKVARTFRLTPAEARVLAAIMRGGGLGRAAAQLGVVRHTAKTQLHNVFEKTGVSRQAELIQLVLGATPPVT